jgi:hypothetical protein
MAQRDYIINIDLKQNELLNAALQNVPAKITTGAYVEGFIYKCTAVGDKNVYVKATGHPDADANGWVNLSSIYTHPPNTGGAYPSEDLSGANVLASLVVDAEGHVDTMSTRVLTLTELGHPEANTPLSDALTGAWVVSNVEVNALGHVTLVSKRELENSDLYSLILNDSITSSTYGWSSTEIASEIALAVTSGMTYKGDYNASTNVPVLDNRGTIIAVEVGDTYTVTADGTFFGEVVEVGDTLIAKIDGANALAEWTVVQTNIGAATEIIAGYIRIATQDETNTGTDDTTAITPLKLAVYVANAERTVEEIEDIVGAMISTQTNITVTYVDNGAGAGKITFAVPPTSESVKGVIELATQAEVDTGTDTDKAITPATLQAKLDAYDFEGDAYSETFPNPVLGPPNDKIFPITHDLDTLDVHISVIEVSTGKKIEMQEVVTDVDTVTLSSNSIPTLDQYRVTIQK